MLKFRLNKLKIGFICIDEPKLKILVQNRIGMLRKTLADNQESAK
jgi:hypothetical protein